MKTPKSKHPLWRKWTLIRQAVLNPNSSDYVWAGAQGITCKDIDNFDGFVSWVEADIGPLPSPDMCLHRIDLNKDWRPGNIQWSTRSRVSKDQRKNIFVRIGKRTENITDWCQEYGTSYWTAFRRWKRGVKGKAIFE